MLIILIIIVIVFIILFGKRNNTEHLTYDPRDPRYVPIDMDPAELDEVTARRFFRLVPIYANVKLDKYNKVEHIFYETPPIEQGETSCYQVKCPSWFHRIRCWKCQ